MYYILLRKQTLETVTFVAGHFTQMVWVATRFFGVGKARSRAGKVIVVANYSPPGMNKGVPLCPLHNLSKG